MKLQFIITAAMLLCLGVPAQARHIDFDTHFSDTTLRLNYIFSGNAACQHIAVSNYCKSAHWWGKRHRLAQVPVEGNGQLTMRLHRTGEVIYRNSFSTLFQEWLTSPEAQVASRAFENVFLVPMPVDTVDITVDLRDSRHRVAASLTHQVVPSDILTRNTDAAGTAPHVVVQRAADSLRCIHIAYVAEGYTQAEMATFLADVDKANEALFAHEPFKSNRNKFSIVAVTAPSAQSGTSEPGNGVWRNTLLQSHFDTFYSDRYLTTLALNRLHDVLAGIPYEHIIVLVNSSKYGGGGILNSYDLSSTHHKAFAQVIVHEFGHRRRTLPIPATWSLGSPTSPRWHISRASGSSSSPATLPCPRRSTRLGSTVPASTRAPATASRACIAPIPTAACAPMPCPTFAPCAARP